jgi:hypothetical protein
VDADAWLRRDARSRDGGIREELAAGMTVAGRVWAVAPAAASGVAIQNNSGPPKDLPFGRW